MRRTCVRFLGLALTCASGCWGLAALGAELRTSVGDRPLVRQASFEQDVLDPDAFGLDESLSLNGAWGGHDDCCAGCATCQPVGLAARGPIRQWATVEYLLWARQGREFPPLVTSSPAGTGEGVAGELGEASTAILFGDDEYGDDGGSGARVVLGAWLDNSQCWGISGSFWILADENVDFALSSDQNAIIARPFFDAEVVEQSALLVAFPGVRTGSINVASHSDVLGADATLRQRLCQTGCGRLELLLGYQLARIDEDLIVSSQSTVTQVGGNLPVGTTLELVDVFETENEFHGGSLGLAGGWDGGCWKLEALGKVALGNMHRTISIAGRTRTTVPGGGASDLASGLLAQPSNSGVFEDNSFAIVPELHLTVTRPLSRCMDLSLGYSLIYFSDVVQPGDQIDLNVDLSQPEGAPPTFVRQESDYWVHGLRAGVQARY